MTSSAGSRLATPETGPFGTFREIPCLDGTSVDEQEGKNDESRNRDVCGAADSEGDEAQGDKEDHDRQRKLLDVARQHAVRLRDR
jgi:hypothetical protein